MYVRKIMNVFIYYNRTVWFGFWRSTKEVCGREFSRCAIKPPTTGLGKPADMPRIPFPFLKVGGIGLAAVRDR
jgi:hypothetical protein